MNDVLLITGPMNATQLGVPDDADYDVVQVHPKGRDLGSTSYFQAMQTWLEGLPLLERLQKAVDGPVDKVGVAWFSAGHGAVKALLKGETVASDVVAWLCLDGLYGSNAFAVDIATAAMENHTSILATASTSTPGSYDHSLDRWRDAIDKAGVPTLSTSDATAWGLPAPDECWGKNGCLIAGYENLGHHKQVPAVRESMLRWWDFARVDQPSPVKPDEPEPKASSGWTTGLVVTGVVALGIWSAWKVAQKK